MKNIEKLPDIVYPRSLVQKTNEIIDVLNQVTDGRYSEENPALTPVEGICTWTVTHNLGTEDITYEIYEGASPIVIDSTIVSSNVIEVKIKSSSNVSAKTYKITVLSGKVIEV